MSRFVLYAAAVLVTVLLSVGNLMLKLIAGQLGSALLSLRQLDPRPLLSVSPKVLVIGCIYATGSALWLWVLDQLPLNRAFMFVSLTFVFVPILSHFVLNEEVGLGVIIGSPIIIVGLMTAVLLH